MLRKSSVLIMLLFVCVTGMQVFGQDVQTLYAEGKEAFAKRDFETAITRFRDVLSLSPKFYYAYLKLGQSYMGVGNLDEAINILKEAENVDASKYQHQIELGKIFKKKKQYDQAITHFQKAVDKLSGDVNKKTVRMYGMAAYSLAEVYYLAKKDYQKTYNVLADAYSKGAKSANVVGLLAKAAFRLGKKKEALNYYNGTGVMNKTKLTKSSFYTLTEYLSLAMSMKDDALAVSIGEKMVNTPKPAAFNAEAFSNLGRAYMLANKYSQAIDMFKKALANNAKDPADEYKYLGTSYFSLKQYKSSMENLQQSLKIHPNDPETLYYLGLNSNKLKEYEQAKQYYEKALKLKPKYTAATKALEVVQKQIDQENKKKAEEERIKQLEEEEKERQEEEQGFIQ